VIATAVWLLGDAVGHVQQIIVADNWSPNNAGVALYNDIAVPLILIALLVIARRRQAITPDRRTALQR
jgi:hypothetical protein